MLFLLLKDRDFIYLVLYICAILVQASMLDGRIKNLLPADLGIQYRIIQPLLTIPPLFALLLFSSSFLKIPTAPIPWGPLSSRDRRETFPPRRRSPLTRIAAPSRPLRIRAPTG